MDLRKAVRRASRGDQASAALLFDRYHPRVYRYALSKLGNPTFAEDVAAETFARVLRDLGRFRWKGAGFEAWIFRIATNLVVDQVRAIEKEHATVPDVEQDDSNNEPTLELAFVESESRDALTAMLAQLAPPQREVLLLRFAADLDTREVARIMGRKPNAVRQLQFRALEKLRHMMLQRSAT